VGGEGGSGGDGEGDGSRGGDGGLSGGGTPGDSAVDSGWAGGGGGGDGPGSGGGVGGLGGYGTGGLGGGGKTVGSSFGPKRTTRIGMQAKSLLGSGSVATHETKRSTTSRGATYEHVTTEKVALQSEGAGQSANSVPVNDVCALRASSLHLALAASSSTSLKIELEFLWRCTYSCVSAYHTPTANS